MATATFTGKGGPSPRLLTPKNSMLLLIDHQPQMAFASHSIDIQLLINNVTGLAKSAKIFDVPVVLTTVAAKSFSGPIFAPVQEVYPSTDPIDRTTMNCWEDPKVVQAVRATDRKKIIMAALWTEVCLATACLSALDDGFEVYIVTDASAGVTAEAHEMAIQRMVQAGAIPTTWLQVLLEWQRDWARQETYNAVMNVAKEHAGGYGLGINYAKTMLGEHASEGGK
ncbi:hydrolase [Geomesophilobacter sediminis]|uniref:Hydrolase n=1 Tax=Geomesophilobacter sediminis TaxID=2798584 RepID=A0A8J7JCD2_9BACT|nr:hydrolase [Geomesophilobacter sediminis]MBJ6724433.1 hydrolase [Geomesophilobacter sediminis]